MKADAKEAYTNALVEHARRKTAGATQPVIVNAYRFFDEACSRGCKSKDDSDGTPEKLYHPFQKGNVKQILEQFTDPFQAGCLSGSSGEDGDSGFPICVIKVTRDVIEKARHGKQAVVDDQNTPEVYRMAATVRSNNPHAGWALFSPQADRRHPIVVSSFAVQRQRIETSRSKFNERVHRIEPALVIDGQKRLESSAVS